MPSYQQAAVQNYLTNYKPSSVPNAMFNATGFFRLFLFAFREGFFISGSCLPTYLRERVSSTFLSSSSDGD